MDAGATQRDCCREFSSRRFDQRSGSAIWYPAKSLDGLAPATRAGDCRREAEEQAGAVRSRSDQSSVTDGTIEIDHAIGLVRVRGIVDAGMLREVLAAIR